MKEKSHIDEMRAALRGDIERARERRGTTLLDREAEPEPESQTDVSHTPIEAPELETQVSDPVEPTPKRLFRRFLRD